MLHLLYIICGLSLDSSDTAKENIRTTSYSMMCRIHDRQTHCLLQQLVLSSCILITRPRERLHHHILDLDELYEENDNDNNWAKADMSIEGQTDEEEMQMPMIAN